jgi:hypothetical protein
MYPRFLTDNIKITLNSKISSLAQLSMLFYYNKPNGMSIAKRLNFDSQDSITFAEAKSRALYGYTPQATPDRRPTEAPEPVSKSNQ